MPVDYLAKLSRAQLAKLGREYMVAAQFNSRTGYAALQINHGPEAYLQVAIDNWMAVSPIYTQRMQRAMRTNTGSDIATILKGMQLECGLSHQYFDAGMQEVSDTEGYFWLNSCGPLLETEPRGEEAVITMCHHVEDPTFDATAVATNPKARIRPVHRPPRVPADRSPHCRWMVTIEPDVEPLLEREITAEMRQTELAALVLNASTTGSDAGMDYYDGPLLETLQLERFSKPALEIICKELAVQIHLLINALAHVVGGQYGQGAADVISQFQLTGTGRVVSERLRKMLGHEEGGIDAVVDVLQIHPAFQPPEYYGMSIEKTGRDSAQLSFSAAGASREPNPLGWYRQMQGGANEALESLVKGVDAGAILEAVPGEAMRWDIRIEKETAEEEPLAVQIAKGTVLYSTQLQDHIQLLELS